MSDALLDPGTEIAGYRIERLVARGGMGAVYEAVQLSLDRRVAMKLIAEGLGRDERFRERFRREARSAASIHHPNILPVYEAGELPGGRLFLTMQFVDGPDLNTLLKERGQLDVEESVAILSQIAEALDCAHQSGLIHRDVKPANVMLDPRESGWCAYLTDFGLAKPNDDASEHTAPGEILGTIDYMAPELVHGAKLDARADVYSFGCMAYRCLTGRLPYQRESRTATVMAHANAPVPVPSQVVDGVPAPLDMVVLRALEKDPEKRARSAGGLMRWARSELQRDAEPPEPRTVVSQTVTARREAADSATRPHAPATAVGSRAAGGGGGAAAAGRSRAATTRPRRAQSTVKSALWHAAAYAPVWVASYLFGRSL